MITKLYADYRIVAAFKKLGCLFTSFLFPHTSQTLSLFSSGIARTIFIPFVLKTLPPTLFPATG
jgi:hypothetical protein